MIQNVKKKVLYKSYITNLSKYSSSLIIQLSHMTISCSCSGVLHPDTQDRG